MTLGALDLGTHLGTHAGFILASYAFTAVVMGGLILNAIRDRRAQRRALAQLQVEERR